MKNIMIIIGLGIVFISSVLFLIKFSTSCILGGCKIEEKAMLSKDNYKPAIQENYKIVEYSASFWGMQKAISLFQNGDFILIDKTAPMSEEKIIECQKGKISQEEISILIEYIRNKDVTNVEFTQKNDQSMICEGSINLTVNIDGKNKTISPPCVDSKTDETNKISNIIEEIKNKLYEITSVAEKEICTQ